MHNSNEASGCNVGAQRLSNNNCLNTLTVSLAQIIFYLCAKKKSSFDRIIWLHIVIQNGVNFFTGCTFHVTRGDKVTQD